ncbi:MAG: hypothetical protein AAFN41_03240, partial [Planctomycetota bacterium]
AFWNVFLGEDEQGVRLHLRIAGVAARRGRGEGLGPRGGRSGVEAGPSFLVVVSVLGGLIA